MSLFSNILNMAKTSTTTTEEVVETAPTPTTEEVVETAPVIGDSVNELTAPLRAAAKNFVLASQIETHIDAIERLMLVK